MLIFVSEKNRPLLLAKGVVGLFSLCFKKLYHYEKVESIYTALQKFGITLVSWSTHDNTAAQMTIFSRISHRIFQNFVW